MSPFSSFNDKDFNKNLICLQGIAYNPCPEGCGGVFFSKTCFLSGNQLRWTRRLSQKFDWRCLGKWWVGGQL